MPEESVVEEGVAKVREQATRMYVSKSRGQQSDREQEHQTLKTIFPKNKSIVNTLQSETEQHREQ